VRAPAPAKINLALVVGPLRDDGKHELATVYQRVGMSDRIDVTPAAELRVDGFPGDTLVRDALDALAVRAGVEPRWHATIEKRLPVAAGLGGGSSDAATALRLANQLLAAPLARSELHALAARVGADVPFFLSCGPQLGTGDGTVLEPVDLPQDYAVLLLLPAGDEKRSTADVYAAFDARGGEDGYAARAAAVHAALLARDLAALPPNDLATSPFAERLRAEGAFRADVSGAGPVVYGLFESRDDAKRAQAALRRLGETWVTRPAWYG
jgi:4-diphosphocytidyl-2-C-methyl-D-erythritol kinase